MEMDGHTITSAFLMFGFSLFGKNVLNIWSILFGVFLYAKYHKTSVSRYLYIGFYGTSLSPIITQAMQIETLPPAAGLFLSLWTVSYTHLDVYKRQNNNNALDQTQGGEP